MKLSRTHQRLPWGALFVLHLVPASALAEWQPADGVWISTSDGGTHYRPTVVPYQDPGPGVYIVWDGGPSGQIYVQKIEDAGGSPNYPPPPWGTAPRLACGLAGQRNVSAISDNDGGVFIAWEDASSAVSKAIRAQWLRPEPDGFVWGSDGRSILSSPNNQASPVIARDQRGHAIVAWEDERPGGARIYASGVSSAGAPSADVPPCCDTIPVLWQGELCPNTSGTQCRPAIVTSEDSSAIVVWEDYRNGNANIYAQRVNAYTGERMWTDVGVAICSEPHMQLEPVVVTDGGGGAIVAWRDRRGSPQNAIYAAHVLKDGTVIWADKPVCVKQGAQPDQIAIVSDDASGALIAWQDFRNGPDANIYCQRLGPSGDRDQAWLVDGNMVCDAAGTQSWPQIASDGNHGAYVVWYDNRSEVSTDIYIHRIGQNGKLACEKPDGWLNGHRLCDRVESQFRPAVALTSSLVPVAAWEDDRGQAAGGAIDIYAQKASPPCLTAVGDGSEPMFGLKPSGPNPFSDDLRLTMTLAAPARAVLEVFDLTGRRISTVVRRTFPAGEHTLVWNGLTDAGADAPAGLYLLRARVGGREWRQKVVRIR